jgi:adenosylcobinamide kinase / adenosylcobinamide-phosphate guanylyltransferase
MQTEASKLIFVLGGARAGKSTFALQLAEAQCETQEVSFIPTAQGLDDEMSARIARHREERPAGWTTIEEPLRIDEALNRASGSRVVIVDCLTLFVSNWLVRGEDEAEKVMAAFLDLAQSRSQTIICVSNEVGLGIVPQTPLGRSFRDVLGRVNQQVAKAAAEVYLLIAGLPVRIK